ncbi:MAG: serine/threonine protein kinase [Candidatus Dormibacteraeota bacterium]|nr:serine/threonine protein kinase [Candidatus Dormibacteraeota bacterium]
MEGGIPRGTQIGSYVIDSLLGRGGMGVVYKAFHPRLERWAAIKLLPPFQTSSNARERFEREARAVARLRHRHILSVFDFGEFSGQPYMVVEFMPNGSLQERMPAGPISPREALAILRPLGEALDYAHSQGVLHRDVKPANVFLDGELQPVLADFGLAKMYGDQSLTASGMISGTPTHISPEQTMGQPLTNASDLYSLAVIGFQLLTGRLPFIGEGMMDLLYAQVHADVPLPSTINPNLPPQVDAVLLRAMAKDPTRRWTSAADMLAALESAAASPLAAPARGATLPVAVGAPITPAALPLVTASVSAPGAAGPASASQAGADMANPPRHRRRWAGAVIALLVVGLVATLVALNSPRRSAIGPPSATPSLTAAPTARGGRSLSLNPSGTLRRGSALTVSGHGLDPRHDAGVGILQRDLVHPINAGMKVASDGSFSTEGIVPLDLATGPATVVACNFTDAKHTTDLTRCVETNVTIATGVG